VMASDREVMSSSPRATRTGCVKVKDIRICSNAPSLELRVENRGSFGYDLKNGVRRMSQ
jgi:hypothetical protein